MDIYQVQNLSGNPASREGNEDAIFLEVEYAEAHVRYLHEDCGLSDIEFKIVNLNKNHTNGDT